MRFTTARWRRMSWPRRLLAITTVGLYVVWAVAWFGFHLNWFLLMVVILVLVIVQAVIAWREWTNHPIERPDHSGEH